MARKPTPVIIEQSEFRIYLASKMITQHLSVAELAESIGVSTPIAYKLLAGDLPPNEQTLKRVGLRIVFVRDESQVEEVGKAKTKK